MTNACNKKEATEPQKMIDKVSNLLISPISPFPISKNKKINKQKQQKFLYELFMYKQLLYVTLDDKWN